MSDESEKPRGWKAKVIEELQLVGAVSLYIFLTLSNLSLYREMAAPGGSVSGFQLGYNLIESLVIAKVIIIGDLLKVSHRYRDRPLIYATLFRSFLFSLFILFFSSLELFVEGLIHHDTMAAAMDAVWNKERGMRLVQVGTMFLAGIPLFAVWEVANRIGTKKIIDLFFRERPAS